MPVKKSAASDVIVRSAVVQLLSHIERRSLHDVLLGRYGEDDSIKAMLDVTTKAATVPATTTAVGWAAELVQTATLDLIEQLVGKSIYPILRDIGGKFSFGRNGVVSLPARSSGASVAGSFVGQGAPIPVRQAAFSATALTPKKMAVITTFTREIAEKSTPDIEQVLRQAIQEDTGVAIDTILMDAGAATVIRPAGLRNGVTAATATAGGGFAALVADLKALVAALIASSNGNIRQPVWILNPVQVLSISLTQNAGGDFPFAADLRAGTLLGYPVAASATVPLGTVALVDAADFFTATGDEPRFDVSDQATLHMEDTTPLAISAAGTPSGSEYMGGSLSAGFRTNAVRATMIAANADVTTGPFESAGRPRTVTVSLLFSTNVSNTGTCPAGPVTPSVTVELYRGTSAAGVILSSRTIVGGYSCEPGRPNDPGSIVEQISGSFTYTDNSGGNTSSYYVRLTNRTTNTTPDQQVLSLLSVEQ